MLIQLLAGAWGGIFTGLHKTKKPQTLFQLQGLTVHLIKVEWAFNITEEPEFPVQDAMDESLMLIQLLAGVWASYRVHTK